MYTFAFTALSVVAYAIVGTVMLAVGVIAKAKRDKDD